MFHMRETHNRIKSFGLKVMSCVLLCGISLSPKAQATADYMSFPEVRNLLVAINHVNFTMQQAAMNPMDQWRRTAVNTAISQLPNAILDVADVFYAGRLKDKDLPGLEKLMGGFVSMEAPSMYQEFFKSPTQQNIPTLSTNIAPVEVPQSSHSPVAQQNSNSNFDEIDELYEKAEKEIVSEELVELSRQPLKGAQKTSQSVRKPASTKSLVFDEKAKNKKSDQLLMPQLQKKNTFSPKAIKTQDKKGQLRSSLWVPFFQGVASLMMSRDAHARASTDLGEQIQSGLGKSFSSGGQMGELRDACEACVQERGSFEACARTPQDPCSVFAELGDPPGEGGSGSGGGGGGKSGSGGGSGGGGGAAAFSAIGSAVGQVGTAYFQGRAKIKTAEAGADADKTIASLEANKEVKIGELKKDETLSVSENQVTMNANNNATQLELKQMEGQMQKDSDLFKMEVERMKLDSQQKNQMAELLAQNRLLDQQMSLQKQTSDQQFELKKLEMKYAMMARNLSANGGQSRSRLNVQNLGNNNVAAAGAGTLAQALGTGGTQVAANSQDPTLASAYGVKSPKRGQVRLSRYGFLNLASKNEQEAPIEREKLLAKTPSRLRNDQSMRAALNNPKKSLIRGFVPSQTQEQGVEDFWSEEDKRPLFLLPLNQGIASRIASSGTRINEEAEKSSRSYAQRSPSSSSSTVISRSRALVPQSASSHGPRGNRSDYQGNFFR